MDYNIIAEDVRNRIRAEASAKMGARRSFLQSIADEAAKQMESLDRQRLEHFLARAMAEAELARALMQLRVVTKYKNKSRA